MHAERAGTNIGPFFFSETTHVRKPGLQTFRILNSHDPMESQGCFEILWQPTGVQIPFELRILFHVSPNCHKLLVRAVKPIFSSFIKVYMYNKRNIRTWLGRQMENA